MALSSRRVWILLASVVALGIVLVGAVAFASPKKDAVNHENGKGRTLTVMIKSREAAVVDVGDRGLSHGDARVVNARFTTRAATRSGASTCTASRPTPPTSPRRRPAWRSAFSPTPCPAERSTPKA